LLLESTAWQAPRVLIFLGTRLVEVKGRTAGFLAETFVVARACDTAVLSSVHLFISSQEKASIATRDTLSCG
jgi:hypothetical protein